MKRLFIIVLLSLTLGAIGCEAQTVNQMRRRCPGPTPVVPWAVVEIEFDGDIELLPCSGRTVNITGLTGAITSLNGLTAGVQTFAAPTAADTASWSSVTATHTLRLPITSISGSSRTNFFPYFDAANTFAKSPFSWNGTDYFWNNAALNATFDLNFRPGLTTNGIFEVGDTATRSNGFLRLDGDSFELETGGLLNIRSLDIGTLSSVAGLNIDSPTVIVGDVAGVSNQVFLGISNASNQFTFASGGVDATFSTAGIQTFTFNRTVTPGGTTGNQTINRPVGTVNFAAAATSLTVTNSTVTASSIILATARTNDSTCSVKNVVAGVGSFVINMTAACTAETSVGFWVTN